MNLDGYKQVLYNEAKSQERFGKYTLYLSITFLLISFYLQGFYIYYPSVFALMLQVCAWYFSWKSKELRRLAHEIQIALMLQKVYGEIVDKFSLSSLIVSFPSEMHRKVEKIGDLSSNNVSIIWLLIKKMEIYCFAGILFLYKSLESIDSYNTGNTDEPTAKLLKMVQGNTFWNHHLYKEEFRHRFKILFTIILIFISGILLSLPLIKLDENYTIVRLFITIASLPIFYELIESIIILRRSSLSMRDIDNDISRITDLNQHQLINVFSKYSNIILETPDISDRVFKKNKQQLKKSWNYRIQRE